MSKEIKKKNIYISATNKTTSKAEDWRNLGKM